MEKLVRDRIPELSGRKDYRTANGPEEFKNLLFAKLREEVDELIESPSLEELADVRTVLAFIQTFVLESTEQQLQEAMWEKARNNGLFHSKIVMDFPREIKVNPILSAPYGVPKYKCICSNFQGDHDDDCLLFNSYPKDIYEDFLPTRQE